MSLHSDDVLGGVLRKNAGSKTATSQGKRLIQTKKQVARVLRWGNAWHSRRDVHVHARGGNYISIHRQYTREKKAAGSIKQNDAVDVFIHFVENDASLLRKCHSHVLFFKDILNDWNIKYIKYANAVPTYPKS